MRKTTSICIILLISLGLIGCKGTKPSAQETSQASSPSQNATSGETDSQQESLLDEVTDADDDFVPAPEYNNAMNQVMEASAYSSTLDDSWQTMKGMDYSEKEDFLKQAKGLVSEAGTKIGSLEQLSSVFGGKTSQKLASMISKLAKQRDSLKKLVSQGTGVDAAGWADYKGKVGSAISTLSGGFTNLSSLAK